MKTIAVDLDDTLNDFSETLRSTRFSDSGTFGVSAEVYETYLARLRGGEADTDELLSTEYSYFCFNIHLECYRVAKARADGVEFMRWLREKGWRIVICTHRDLRRSNECTREWLGDNGIPFDYLFRALNKLEFCRVWGIRYLVDDHLWNLVQEGSYDVEVFHPRMAKHVEREFLRGKGFGSFEEVKQWIRG
jgi:hypothetical protein